MTAATIQTCIKRLRDGWPMPCNPGMADEYARVMAHYPIDLVEKTITYIIDGELVRPGNVILRRYLDQALEAMRQAQHNKIKRETPKEIKAATPYGRRCLAILGMSMKGEYGSPKFVESINSLIKDFPVYRVEWEAVLEDARTFMQEKASIKDAEMEWGLRSTGRTWRSDYNIPDWIDKKPLRLFESDTQKAAAGDGK